MSRLADTDIPALLRGVRLREDEARGGWVLLAPERVLELDAVAVAVLREVDGAQNFKAIVAALAAAYKAPEDQISRDARDFLEQLMSMGLIEKKAGAAT